MPPALWYWRTRNGWEVDVLMERSQRLYPIEIKATATPRPAHAARIEHFRHLAGCQAGEGLVVADAERPSALVPGVRVLPWHAL